VIVTATAGKIDSAIGRLEGPLLAYMIKEEADFAKDSIKNKLYNVRKSKHYSESFAGLTGIGPFVPTDGAIPYESLEEGYTKQMIHTVFKKGIEIKRELIDDSRVIDMESLAGELIDSWNMTQEELLHAPFNNCAATTFTFGGKTFDISTADGQALASNAHPSKTGKGSDQDNYTTNAFSIANLKTAEDMMAAIKTDVGNKGNVKGDTIFASYSLRNEIWEAVHSLGKVNSGDNNVNPYKDKFNVIISDWLDDGKWFLIDSRVLRRNLYFLERKPLEVKSQIDFNTDNWQIKAYARNSLGFKSWEAIVCNVPSA
jgi:phage major head subunit gpT-like protein